MVGAWPLTGRDEELRAIGEYVLGHDPPGAVIAGVAGIGKTRLASEVLDAAEARGRSIHRVTATESARALPLGVFSELACEFDPDPLRRVRDVVATLAGMRPGPRPVVGVDDAHLLDNLSALVVHQLVRHDLATVLVTVRSGARAPAAIRSLWKDRQLRRLDLRPLSQRETIRLLERGLDGPVDSLSADRIWSMTGGNILYLRQLVEDEVSAGHLRRVEGLWVWNGHPAISSCLAELIDARIGAMSAPLGRVVDVLAVGEPLEVEILDGLIEPGALEQAEDHALVSVETAGATRLVRLAHPLFGEVRRARAGPLRLRRLRGEVAAALAHAGGTGDRDIVRRAVLTLDSDRAADPQLCARAAHCAMRLLDVGLAERFAREAARRDAAFDTRLTHALTLATLDRGEDAERVLSVLATGPLESGQAARVAAMRAGVLLWLTGSPGAAAEVLSRADARIWARTPDVLRAIRMSILAVRGLPLAAIGQAPPLPLRAGSDFDSMMGAWGLAVALGDSGRVGALTAIATRGYELAGRAVDIAHLRFALGVRHANALCAVGRPGEARLVADRIRHDTAGVPGSGQVIASAVDALVALRGGDAATAYRHLLEVRVRAASIGERTPLRVESLAWLVEAAVVSGHRGVAAEALAELREVRRGTDLEFLDPVCAAAEAWVVAADGALSRAVVVLRDCAARARERAQFVWEVTALQLATRFGDRTTAARLAELAAVVDGPRAGSAGAHASALAAGSGAGLLTAARGLESCGDRIAAGDAAAQAAVVFAESGAHGSALTARAFAQRIAAECGCPGTPAQRAAADPLPLTPREREIVLLAARGLSNRAIADQLVLSVRTVEGHLYRACRKVDAADRHDLAAIVRGR